MDDARPVCCILLPVLKQDQAKQLRAPSASLSEAVSLAESIGLEIAYAGIVNLQAPKPSTLIGSGKIAEMLEHVEEGIDLLIVDYALSPLQQRNLERELKVKVIDRTALILEIFGARARTKEGTLQVELAALEYQKSRLVRSWTHLERQRGGAGFMGGPGETQIELDRRIISDKIGVARRALEQVKRSRGLHRKERQSKPYPTIALVGYTNAGKSSLFNTLTKAKVYAQDQLFATLDPTIRSLHLADGLDVMLSDTVGFISNLPTQLIAAFRATLEEVLEADILLHVRDMAHPDAEAQKQDVLDVLTALFGNKDFMERTVEVWNKADLPDYPEPKEPDICCVSAIEGTGLEELRNQLAKQVIAQHYIQPLLLIPYEAAAATAQLYKNAFVIENQATEAGAEVLARVTEAQLGRMLQKYPDIRVLQL